VTLEAMAAALEPDLKRPWEEPVRRHKSLNPGAKVVGCFPVYSPFELIHAAGALPVGLFGAGNQVELTHADSRFVSFVCSIAKSTLELAMQGKLAGFDGLFFHSICDVARNLSSVVRRNLPDTWVEYLHLPQNPSSSAAAGYLRAELQRIERKLGELTGRRPDPNELRRSIVLFNRARGAARWLYTMRAADPDRLSTATLYRLVRSLTFTPVEQWLAQLPRLEAELTRAPAVRRDRIRVVIESAFCEQPPLDLLQAVEEGGCHVVDDDLLKGWRWYREPLDETGDPIDALARGYLDRSDYSSVRQDDRRSKPRDLAAKVRRRRADAVLFLVAKFCEPALFDYVLFKQELEKEKIPHLLIEFEEKMWTFQRVRDEIETFVESILFG
jgi:benzoyl-CoA reductase subunit C